MIHSQSKDMSATTCTKKTWQLIKEMNAGYPDNTAMDLGCVQVTYGEMFREWDNHARMFTALGITRENNSKVMVGLLTCAEAVNVIYGLDMTGGIPYLFMDFRYESARVKQYVRKYGITDIIIHGMWFASFKKIAHQLKEEYGVRNIIIVNSPSANKDIPFPMNITTRMLALPNRLYHNYYSDYYALLDQHKQGEICYDKEPSSAISLVLSSSGSTTGIGHQIPFSDLNRNAMACRIAQSGLNICKRGTRIALQLPLFAPYTCITALNTAFVYGGTVVGDPACFFKLHMKLDWQRSLMAKKPNVILATPVLWKQILDAKDLDGQDLGFLRYAISGGSYASPDDLMKLRNFLRQHGSDGVVVNGYGASEFGGVCMCFTDTFQRLDSMGILLPGVEVLLLDEEGNYHVPEDKPLRGELLVCSDAVATEFPEEESIAQFRTINGKRYYCTRDIVTYDTDGSFDFVSRIDFAFPSPVGLKIYPLIIENNIRSNAQVEDCALIGRPHEEGGYSPVLYLVLRKGVEHTAAVIQDILNQMVKADGNIDKRGHTLMESPEEVVLLRKLPAGNGGKTNYNSLKANPPSGRVFGVKHDFASSSVKVYRK